MPETISTRIDPSTGQEYEVRTESQSVPYVPPDRSGMAGINWSAVQENIKNQGIEAALKATSAAIQFQGLRGYQQALKNGEAPEKAMVKYGPMIFNKQAQAFAPSMRALTPPTITPQNAARNAFEERRVKLLEKAATQPKPAAPPVVTESVRQVPNPNILTQRQTPILSLTNRTTRGLSPQTIAPAPQVLPLPKSKDELKKGARYSTARGEATWNGEKFVK